MRGVPQPRLPSLAGHWLDPPRRRTTRTNRRRRRPEGQQPGEARTAPFQGTDSRAQNRPLLVPQTVRITFIFLPFQYILNRPKSKSILTWTSPHA